VAPQDPRPLREWLCPRPVEHWWKIGTARYAPPMDLITALNESWGAAITLLEGLGDASWDRPTPCEGWTVRDIAAHLGHIEGIAHGYPQPPTPDDFDASSFEAFHGFTEEGVAARRPLPITDVLGEVVTAAEATLSQVGAYDEAEWEQPVPSPVGMVPAHQAAEIRMSDVQVHLLDMRAALGIPISGDEEPAATRILVNRALRLSGWGAVKGAGLPDGTRIRIEIEGRDPRDLVVSERKGFLADTEGHPTDRIAGTGLAFALAVAGRGGMAEAAGGLTVEGNLARSFLEGYRLFM